MERTTEQVTKLESSGGSASLLLRIRPELKKLIEDTADAEGVSVNQWATECLEENITDEALMGVQHREARKLLPLIFEAAQKDQPLTYATAAKALGRDPRTNGRMVGGVCDLIDAAAALAGTPLLALYHVRKSDGAVNPEAFADEPDLRAAVLNRAKKHTFTQADVAAIRVALDQLRDMKLGNQTAWRRVREAQPDFAKPTV